MILVLGGMDMDQDYIRQRLTELRMKKGVSEYKMSLDLGHSKSYIQSISSGRALPLIPEFLSICEYFSITPSEFFDENLQEPALLHELISKASALKPEDLSVLLTIADRLGAK